MPRFRPHQRQLAQLAAALVAKVAQIVQDGLDPADVAGQVLRVIRQGQFYVFTHPDYCAMLDERHATIMAAIDRTAHG